MTIAYRAGSTAGNSSGGDLTINKPTGTLDNDILVVVLYREAGTWTLPTGWTAWLSDQRDFGNNLYLTIAWKRASGEGSNYTFSLSTSTWRIAAMAAFSGCVTSGDPIDCTATGRGTNESMTSSGPIASSITNATANSMNVAVTANYNGTDPSAGSSGYTEGANIGGCEIWYAIQAASGASGNKTFGGFSGSDTGLWATIHISLKEAGGGGTNYPRSISFTQNSSVNATRVFNALRTISFTQNSSFSSARAVTNTRSVSFSQASNVSAGRVLNALRAISLSVASAVSASRIPIIARAISLSVASSLSASRLAAFFRSITLNVANAFTVEREGETVFGTPPTEFTTAELTLLTAQRNLAVATGPRAAALTQPIRSVRSDE